MSDTDTHAPQDQGPAPAATPAAPEDTSAAREQDQAVTPTDPVVETTTPVTPEVTVASEEDGFLGGKYKSKEDFENAYKNLQTTRQRELQEAAELRSVLQAAFATDDDTTDPATAGYAGYDDDKADSVVANRLVNMEFAMAHPDADGKAILDVMKNDPVAKQIQSYEARLRYAYLASKEKAAPQQVAEAQRQAAADAKAKVVEKQAAQVEPATKQSAPTQEEPLTRDQLRAALRDDKAFGDILKKKFPGVSQMMS